MSLGNTQENINNNVYSSNFADNTYNTDIWLRNNIYKNVTGQQGAGYILYGNALISENEIFQNSSYFGSFVFAYMELNSITIKNMTLKNSNGTNTSSADFIYLILNDDGSSIIDGLTFTDSNLGYQVGIYIQDNINSLIIQNWLFQNLIVGTSNNIINTGSFQSLQILNSVFENISSQTSDDYGNIMIEVKSINLTSASDSLISNITIQNSVIGFVDFYTIVGSPNQTINFIISDIYYENWVIQNQIDLISFGSLQTQEDISFTIDSINFSNVTFLKYGNLLSFQQQIANILLLQNSNFQNVVSAFIYIEAANKQNLNVTTKVRISNTTFTNISAQYGSIIQVNEGGYLEIDQSSFSTIYWFEEGPVLYAGSQRATVIITNSTFYNNTSLQGGVFNVDSESVIKIYNWEISYNFGVVVVSFMQITTDIMKYMDPIFTIIMLFLAVYRRFMMLQLFQ